MDDVDNFPICSSFRVSTAYFLYSVIITVSTYILFRLGRKIKSCYFCFRSSFPCSKHTAPNDSSSSCIAGISGPSQKCYCFWHICATDHIESSQLSKAVQICQTDIEHADACARILPVSTTWVYASLKVIRERSGPRKVWMFDPESIPSYSLQSVTRELLANIKKKESVTFDLSYKDSLVRKINVESDGDLRESKKMLTDHDLKLITCISISLLLQP